MKEEIRLNERFGRDAGFRVPEGYFESVFAQIAENLPAPAERPSVPQLSLWQKIRPYVYMAAMFAGIWCMMKVFHTMASGDTLNLDTPPEAVALAMADPNAIDSYLPESYESDFELEEMVLSQYDDMDKFKEDFDYDLSPQYAEMTLPERI